MSSRMTSRMSSRRVGQRPDLLLERGSHDRPLEVLDPVDDPVVLLPQREQPVANPLGAPALGHPQLLLPRLLGGLARGAAAVGDLPARGPGAHPLVLSRSW